MLDDVDDPRAPPLRIALLTHSVNPRGGVVHTLELAHALRNAGHDVTVIAPALPGEEFFRPVHCKVELVETPPSPSDMVEMVEQRIAACVNHLSQTLPERRYDVLHSQDSITGNALATLDSCGMIRGFVRTVHHLDRFGDPGLMALQRRAFLRAERVLCVSQLWQDQLREEYGIDAAQVNNGVDMKRFSPRTRPADPVVARTHGLRPGAPLLLAVGGVEERKNTVRMLEGFLQLRELYPQAQLVIVGGASLLDHSACARAFWARADAAGLRIGHGESLVLTGAVPDDEMPSLMRLADAVVMASIREGFGLVVLEALASGTPVVASRIAPFTEYLNDNDVEWADPMQAESIAAAMARSVIKPTFVPPAVCRRYSWDASAARHAALYRSLVAVPATIY